MCGTDYFREKKVALFFINVNVTNLGFSYGSLAAHSQLSRTCLWFGYFVYSSSLPVAHLSDAPGRRLVVMGDSARIQDETTENSAWFFNVPVYSTVTRDLGLTSHPKDY